MPRLITNSIPIGSIHKYTSGTLPDGYLACDGSAVSRSIYADLFTILGTTYGSGDGSTTFNVPDFRGRHPVGDGIGAGLTNRALGQSFGAEVHTLASGNLPTHTHGVGTLGAANTDLSHTHSVSATTGTESSDHSHNDSGHAHNIRSSSYAGDRPVGMGNGGGDGAFYMIQDALISDQGQLYAQAASASLGGRTAAHTHAFSTTSGSASISLNHAHSLSGATDNGGFSNSSVNHMNPSLVVKFMIRY